MRDLKLDNMIERIASKLAEALGWNVIGKVDYSLWQKYGRNRTYVRVKFICIKGEKRSERKIFGYDFGFIDNEDGKHYFRPGEYYDEEDLYNDVMYQIYDYFHILNDIKIVETYNGNEYYVDIDVRKGKPVYSPCYRRAVKGFSYMLGSNEYENEEGAIDYIKKHIEEKRREKEEKKERKKEWDRIFGEFQRELEEAYIEATSPVLDDSWKVVKIEGDEITYKKGRESITLKRSKPE